MIKLKNIDACYSSEQVLHNLSATIHPGEMVALIGANGSGKTTLLKVITGAHEARGDVLVKGRPVRKLSGSERAAILAVVPQDIPVDIPLRGSEFVMLGRTHHMRRFMPPTKVDHAAVERAMAYTATEDLRERFLSEMSGGERQRIALATAFAAQPEIILLDEATSHLDLHHRVEIMNLLREKNQNQSVTVLMAVHDLSLASRYFDRLILLKEGRILVDGPPSEVLQTTTLEDAYNCRVRVVNLPDHLGASIIPL